MIRTICLISLFLFSPQTVRAASPTGKTASEELSGGGTPPSDSANVGTGTTPRADGTEQGNAAGQQAPKTDPLHQVYTQRAAETSAPVAQSAGQQISNTLDVSQGGALDPVRVEQAQAAAGSAISQSEYIDQLYVKHKITKEEWKYLKANMTASMLAPIDALSSSLVLPKQSASVSRSSRTGLSAPSSAVAPDASSNASSTFSNSSPAEVVVDLNSRSDSRRPLAQIPESDPIEVGAGAQVLSLNSSGPMVVGSTLVPDKVSEAQAFESSKNSGNQKNLQMDENVKTHSASGQTVVLGAHSISATEKGLDHDRALLVAQKILNDQKMKGGKSVAKSNANNASEAAAAPTASSVEVAQAKAMASLQNLPKVKRVQGMDGRDASGSKINPDDVGAALALSNNRAPASVNGELESGEEGLSNTSLLLMGLLGAFAGLAVAYGLFMRPQKSIVQLMVPGAGEHFAVRPGSKSGEFILDIMDIRGKLVKTAGTLRPNSVARASVLPPDLAARLGAKGNFERFELTADGEFVATEKEEGYQIFPFVNYASKKAS